MAQAALRAAILQQAAAEWVALEKVNPSPALPASSLGDGSGVGEG